MKKSTAYHLSISVSDGTKSKDFYDKLFTELQWETVDEGEEYAGYSDGSFTLWIIPAENKIAEKHHFKSVGFHHFSIRASQKQAIDQIYQWCLKHKIEVVDPPKSYPEYSPNYYAVFFLDPDGMKIEVTYL